MVSVPKRVIESFPGEFKQQSQEEMQKNILFPYLLEQAICLWNLENNLDSSHSIWSDLFLRDPQNRIGGDGTGCASLESRG